MVLEPGDMLLPDSSYWFRAQVALLPNASLVKQGFRPLSQGASNPGINGHPKAHLWPFGQLSRNIPRQHTAQDPFPSVLAESHVRWQRPGKLNDILVQQGTADFQPDCHARAIDFYQDV